MDDLMSRKHWAVYEGGGRQGGRGSNNLPLCVSVRLMRCEPLSPCDMEGLPAAMFVAGHAGSSGGFALSALVLADVTRLQTHTHTHQKSFRDVNGATQVNSGYLVVAFVRHRLEDDGLHGGDVGELHLGDVQSAHHVGPP